MQHGLFSIELADRIETSQRYLRNTAILETRMATWTWQRAARARFLSTLPDPRPDLRPAMIVRLIEPLAGRPVVRVRLRPRFEHGAAAPRISRGSHHIAYHGTAQSFRLTTNGSLSAIADGSPCVIDAPLALVLGPDRTVEEPPLALAQSFMDETRGYWDDWVRSLAIPFEWQAAVIRAAIGLKLCAYRGHGRGCYAASPRRCRRAPTADATGTTATAGCGTATSWSRRSILGATRTMEGYLASSTASSPAAA